MVTITIDTSPERMQDAERALKALLPLVKRTSRTVHLRSAHGTEPIELPREMLDVFLAMLRTIACGNAVAVMPLHVELTTQQAAKMLHVSRPFLVDLLDSGSIPSRKVGTHRRVRLSDVIAYQQADQQRQRERLDELTAEAQRLGLGY